MRNENGSYLIVDSIYHYSMYYDDIIGCVRNVIKKHRGGFANARLLLSQVDTFVYNPSGIVLLHFDPEDGHVDAFTLAICVAAEPGWVEPIALWIETGKGKLLMREGLEVVEKEAFRRFNITRTLVSITRSPERLYNAFYKILGFKKIGFVLERRFS